MNSTPQMCMGEDSTVVGDFDMSFTLGGAGGKVGRDEDDALTGFEQKQGTAHVNDGFRILRAQLGRGLGIG